MEISAGIGYGLADVRTGGEVHDRVHAGEYLGKSTAIEDVTLHQFKAGRQRFVAGAEIVEDDYIVPGSPQSAGGMTADVAGSANNENFHRKFLYKIVLARRNRAAMMVSRLFYTGACLRVSSGGPAGRMSASKKRPLRGRRTADAAVPTLFFRSSERAKR